MTNQLTVIDSAPEKGLSLAELRGIGARAYLAGGPVFGLVVIALYAIALALSSLAMRLSRAEFPLWARNRTWKQARF